MSQSFSPADAGQLLASLVPSRYPEISLAEASHAAASSVLKDFPELIATLPDDWPLRVRAWLRIHGPTGTDIVSDVYTLAGWMLTALLTAIDAGTVRQVIKTAEAEKELQQLRKEVALYKLIPPPDAVPAEPSIVEPGPSEQELDDLAIHEWRNTATSDVKRHMQNDPVFNDRIMRLMAENKI